MVKSSKIYNANIYQLEYRETREDKKEDETKTKRDGGNPVAMYGKESKGEDFYLFPAVDCVEVRCIEVVVLVVVWWREEDNMGETGVILQSSVVLCTALLLVARVEPLRMQVEATLLYICIKCKYEEKEAHDRVFGVIDEWKVGGSPDAWLSRAAWRNVSRAFTYIYVSEV